MKVIVRMRNVSQLLTIVTLLVASQCCRSSASAATVRFFLDTSTPGQFKVLARASADDNFGIASYGIPLTGPITSIDHRSPQALFAIGPNLLAGPAGFTVLRSSDGNAKLTGSQDTITPTPHIIRGMGQRASSFQEEGLTSGAPWEGSPWDADLLIATGIYNPLLGGVGIDLRSVDLLANVFSHAEGTATMAADLLLPSPAIEVRGNNMTIANGDNSPSGLDGTHFGTVQQHSLQQRTFTIFNHDEKVLTLGTPTVTGPFSVVGAFSASVPFLSSTTFTLGLNTTALGTFPGSISFATSDPFANPFEFALAARVIPEPATVALTGMALVGFAGIARRRAEF